MVSEEISERGGFLSLHETADLLEPSSYRLTCALQRGRWRREHSDPPISALIHLMPTVNLDAEPNP
jgi:hypothetical protein